MAPERHVVVWLASVLILWLAQAVVPQDFSGPTQPPALSPWRTAAPSTNAAGQSSAAASGAPGQPLFGQAPGSTSTGQTTGRSPAATVQQAPSSAGASVNAQAGTSADAGQASSANALIAALLEEPSATIAGKPLTLRAALAGAQSAEAQRNVTHAYWQLSEAQGRFRLGAERVSSLQRLVPQQFDRATWQAALTAAQAELADAQVELIAAQYRLAEQCGLRPADGLPLATDLPHTGTYRTHYDVYASRNLPAHTSVLARVLPDRYQAINTRAASVVAAQDALQAACQTYRLGSGELNDCLDCLSRWHQQYVQLLRCVCQYNHEIVDYAVGVAGMQHDVDQLVRMLIRTSRSTTVRQGESGVRQLGADSRQVDAQPVQPAIAGQPAESPSGGHATPDRLESLGQGQPHLAPPPAEDHAPGAAPQPTLAPPETSFETLSPTPAGGMFQPTPTPERAGTFPSTSAEEPAPEPPAPLEPPAPAGESAGAANRPDGWQSTAMPYQANRAAAAPGDEAILAEQYYPGLSQATPSRQAKALGHALFARWPLPEVQEQALQLDGCLERAAPANRLPTVEAYWQLARETALVLARLEQVNHFEQLAIPVFEGRTAPGGAEAMLYVRAARLAAEAELREARLRLRRAQLRLGTLLGVDASENLFASTAPHVGPYVLRYESLSADLQELPDVARLAAEIPAYWNAVCSQATALVEADRNRAAATVAYSGGTQSITRVIQAIEAQQQQTAQLVDLVCRYNRAIGQYALRVVPKSLPPRQLAGTLVLLR